MEGKRYSETKRVRKATKQLDYHTSFSSYYSLVQTREESFIKQLNKLEKDITFDDGLPIEHSFIGSKESTPPIKDIPKIILQNPVFKSYETCQFILHSKGKTVASNHTYGRMKDRCFGHLPAREFNALLNLIKKSKNKNFDQTLIQKKHLDILGTFLGKVFSGKDYQAILIVSRNDFIPANESEHRLFDNFCTFLSPFLDYTVLLNALSNHEGFLKAALNIHPTPLIIKNSREEVVFRNNAPTQAGHDSSEYKLPNNHSLHLFKDFENSSSISSDIIQYQKICLLGELLNTLRHELSNPLFGLKLSAESLSGVTLSPDAKFCLDEINKSISRCQNIIETFSNIYQDREASSEYQLETLISEAISLARSELKDISVEMSLLNFQNQDDQTIFTNHTWLTQIIFNLLVNSAQAMNSNPSSHIKSLKIIVKNLSSKVLIRVSDTGPGLSAEVLKNIFTPFFTTKETGTGLGLTICKNLAQKLNAELKCSNSTDGVGATFTLLLPKKKETHIRENSHY